MLELSSILRFRHGPQLASEVEDPPHYSSGRQESDVISIVCRMSSITPATIPVKNSELQRLLRVIPAHHPIQEINLAL